MPRPRSTKHTLNRTQFGSVLDYYRSLANLRVEDLAVRTKTSARSINFYRTGERHPGKKRLANLCLALGLDKHDCKVLVEAAHYSRAAGPRRVSERASDQTREYVPSFGKLLALYRSLTGLKQEELAARMGHSVRYIQLLEADEEHPGKDSLQRLNAILNLPNYERLIFANAASGLPPPPRVPGLPAPPIFDPAVPTLVGLGQVIGRAAEQAELMRRLMAAQQPAMVGLVGLPGMGKTTLASTLARDPALRTRWVDGVLWASLGERPNITETLLRWAYLLGVPIANVSAVTPDEWKDLLHEAIGDRHLLLIMDDVWRFEDVKALCIGGHNCAMLVTSRFLALAREVVGRDFAILPELNDEDSRHLLRSHAPVLTTLAPSDADTAERMLLGWARGLPLSISLLGRHVQTASVAAGQPQPTSDQAKEVLRATLIDLDDASRRVNLTHRDHLTRNVISLRIVIAASERWLASAVHGAALRALAAFPPKPETFSREAALAVSNAPEEVLEALIEAGMLEHDLGGRLALHQSIHDYLMVNALLKPAEQRVVAYFLDFAERHAQHASVLAGEMPGLLLALKYAATLSAGGELIRLTLLCAPRAQLMGMHTAIAPQLERAVAVARSAGDELVLIELLRMQARNLDHAARSLEAVDALNEALVLSERRGDDLLSATLLIDLGNVTNKTDRPHAFEDARDHLLRALAIAERVGKPDLRCDVLYNLSNTAFAQGLSQDSLTYALEGLAVARTADDRVRISGMLSAAGNIMANLGRYEDAHAYLREGMEIARASGNPVREGYIGINLGVVAINQGSYAEAEDQLKTVLRASEDRGDHRHMAFALANLAQVSLARGQTEQAEKQLNEALRQAKSLHRRDRLTDIYLNLGITALQRGDIAQARANLRAGQEALGDLHYPEFTALLLCYQGECDLLDPTLPRESRLRSARDHLDEALVMAMSLAHPELIGRVQNALGRLYLQEGDVTAALTAFRVTLATVREHRAVIAEAHLGRALAAEREQDFATAREAAQASFDLFTTIGHYRARAARVTLTRLSRASGTPDTTKADQHQEKL